MQSSHCSVKRGIEEIVTEVFAMSRLAVPSLVNSHNSVAHEKIT